MKSTEDVICRLCLQTIVDEDFEEMGEIIKEILDVLLLKINLNITKEPVMCGRCGENLQFLFDFKSTCLYTEDNLFPLYTDKAKLNLKEIYLQTMGEVKVNLLNNPNCEVCRFCMQVIGKGTFNILNEIENKTDLIRSTLLKYFPEMNLAVVEDSVICDVCVDSILNFYIFAMYCLNTERKLYIYRQTKTLNSISKINLSKVQCMEFIEKNDDMGRIVNFEIKMRTYVKKGMITFDTRYGSDIAADVVNQSSGCNSSSVMVLCPPNKKPEKRRQSLKTKSISTPRFKCNSCAYKTQYRPQRTIHMLVHKDPLELTFLKCKLCHFETKHKYYLRRHMHNIHTNQKKYMCDLCTFGTTHRSLLTAHFATHPSKVTVYQCQHCKYKTSYKQSFTSHALIHMDPSQLRMYKCDKCSFETKWKKSLKIHESLKHTQGKPTETYKCHNCSYESKLKRTLVVHMLSHRKLSELTMHKCSVCKYKSRHYSNLRAHQLTHQKSVKPIDTRYKCKICTFETKQRESFNDHIQYHKKQKQDLFLCDLCTFVSKQKGGIKLHQLLHKKPSEVVMFKCSVCSYKSKYRQGLKRHMLRHTNPSEMEMFKCNICPHETNRKDSLKDHIIKTHKINLNKMLH